MSALLAIAAAQAALLCQGSSSGPNSTVGENIRIELNDYGGRMQLPPSILPELGKGGRDGWYELRDFVRSDTQYLATVRVNFINTKRIRIDRLTGTIQIVGDHNGFSGVCEKIDPNAAPKF